MLDEKFFIHQNFSLKNWVRSLILSIKDDRANPDFLRVNGLICFCGKQGSGKTLSAVLYLKKLLDYYPNAIVVTNVSLNPEYFNMENVIKYTGLNQLTDIDNGEQGVIYLLDEIQLEFNSLESKQMNMPILEFVCQQRKARKHVIGTTQVFGRLAKPFREQFKYAVCCNKVLGSFFTQTLYAAENVAFEDDIRVELESKGFKFYCASPEDFKLYDTYEQIKRVRGAFETDGN